MELKNYFKRFGIGWIILGLIFSILFILVNVFTLNLWAGRILSILIIGIFFVFTPFLLGFFGLVRLFWLLVGWVFVYILLSSLATSSSSGEKIPPYPWLFLLPVALLIGIIWETIHYFKLKNKKSLS